MTSCTLADFRSLKKTRPANLIFLLSQAVKIMHDVATQLETVNPLRDEYKVLQGALGLICRVLPLIHEEKEFCMRSMWHEQPFFNNQVNAIKLMEALSLLLFKPGFTVAPLPDNY